MTNSLDQSGCVLVKPGYWTKVTMKCTIYYFPFLFQFLSLKKTDNPVVSDNVRKLLP